MPNLNPKQSQAVNHPGGPLLIVAGAGSGKTKTLTGRVARLIEQGTPPERIIAITFTNKAAKEMANRVKNLLALHPKQNQTTSMPFLGTFHAFGARILREEAHLLGRTPAYTIFDDGDTQNLMKSVLADLQVNREKMPPTKACYLVGKLKNELNESIEDDPLLQSIYNSYEEALQKNNAFDFEDLIEKPVRLFERHAAVKTRHQNRFDHVLVDEFQDTNPAQYRLLQHLAAQHQNISAVGDDAQSIYRFRGSDFRNFLNFEKDWRDVAVITLDQNYRSTGTILKAASAIIAHNKLQKPKELWTENETGETLTVIKNINAEDEAENLGDLIWKTLRAEQHQANKSSLAILYRTNAQSRAIEQALIVRNISYDIFGGLKFYERKEIKDIVAGLRLAHNPKDSVSRDRLQKTFGKRASVAVIQGLLESPLGENPALIIGRFLDLGRYALQVRTKLTNPEDRLENIKELISFASGFKDLGDFLERVSLLEGGDGKRTGNSEDTSKSNVHLMTIHLAKGLEFDRVFLTGVSEGILPHNRSLGSNDELEEERRLMYVAVTRGRKKVTLSFWGYPSRFLYELPGDTVEFIDQSGRGTSLDEEAIYLEE